MRIACLQFAPQVGDVNNNLNRADAVLSRANPDDLDLLVLPELAFSGYNFKSLSDISPFLEPTGAGITSLWARTTALKYNCVVAAGYPEKVDVSRNWPTSPEYYNSAIVVNEDGETIANYRKSHLYYTDETWALEGSNGFYNGHIPGVGWVAMGICMDLNPYRFEAPWSAYEFAFHILDVQANVVVLSMAWLTREDGRHFSRTPKEPDMETLTYWVKRLEPLIRSEGEEEIIVIFANRTGTEEEAVYAGTSAVIGIQNGEVNVYGLLGRGEKELLVVDTSLPPFAKLVYRPDAETVPANGTTVAGSLPTANEPARKTDSPAPSARSTKSDNSGSPLSKSQSSSVTGSSKDTSKDSTRRIYGGHVFIQTEGLTPVNGTFPSTPFEETPASPRYFWLPPDNLRTPDPAATRPSTSNSMLKRADSATLPTRNNIVLSSEHTSEGVKPRSGDDPAELNDLIDTLRKANAKQSTGTACPARPSSPKSRNASRTGRGDRSDSVLAKRPPSSFANRAQGQTSEQDVVFRPESPKSRNASRTRSRTRPTDTPVQVLEQYRATSLSRNQNHHPAPLEVDMRTTSRNSNRQNGVGSMNVAPNQARQHSNSPDLEKIDADLLIFEEGERRPRRDSLECHADEDDFIVYHASMRRDRHGASNSKGEKDAERPGSKKGATGTSNHASSPGFSFAKSPKESWVSSKPQASPDLLDSRAISRGRQRTAKWTEKQASPKHPGFRPTALSPHTEGRDNVQNPVNSDGHRSSGRGKASSKDPAGPSSRTRGDGSNQLRVATNGTTPKAIAPGKISAREASQESLDNASSVYASSIRTLETMSAPTTPESHPPTPKAMVLEPDWDQVTPVQATNVEKVSLKSAEPESDRPKSAVW